MKRVFAFVGALLVICSIAFCAYIVGHRHGVVHADLRTMSYELMAFEEFERSGAEAAKTKLGHLINFREDDLNAETSVFEDWNYWRQVRSQEVRQNNLVHVLFFGMAWCLYMLPWSLMVLGLYRWRKWERFRTQWILAPSVLLGLGMIGGLLVDPPTPSRRFKDFAKIEMPANVKNLHYHLKGGGIADYSDTYYFETTPEEVDRIIAGMCLDEDKFYGSEGLTQTSIKKLPDCPDFSTWKGARKYKGSDETMNWFYELITDDSRTKVYMRIGCI